MTNQQAKEPEVVIQRLDDVGSDSRFYQGVEKDTEEIKWVYPSCTTVIDATFPKSSYLIKWIRENGICGQFEFEKAADIGTKIHATIEQLLMGAAISTENMSFKEKKCVQAFIDWYDEFQPEIIKTEHIVANHQQRFAGAIDLICKLNYESGKKVYKGTYVVDFKTSNQIVDKHKIQVSAYRECIDSQVVDAKCATLHLGNRTIAGWSFAEVDHEKFWPWFIHLRKFFDMLYPDAKPSEVTFPEVFKLDGLSDREPSVKL